jgi:hypothetical protein
VCTGLAPFLQRIQVLGIATAVCRYGEGNKTLEERGRRDKLRARRALDYHWLTSILEGVKVFSKWFI